MTSLVLSAGLVISRLLPSAPSFSVQQTKGEIQ